MADFWETFHDGWHAGMAPAAPLDLAAELQHASEAFRKYADHDSWCRRHLENYNPCTCGYGDALTRIVDAAAPPEATDGGVT